MARNAASSPVSCCTGTSEWCAGSDARPARRHAPGTCPLRVTGTRPAGPLRRLSEPTYRPWHAAAAHLRLAPRPHPAPRRPAATRRRPSSTGWSRRCAASGSTPSWSPATSTTARSPRSTRSRSTTTRSSGCARPAPGWSSRAATTTRRPGSGSAPGWSTRPACTCAPARRRSPSRCCCPTSDGEVAVYGLPYLEPEAVRAVLPPDPGGDPAEPRGHAGVLGRAMACVRADLARRGGRSVVLAHAWVAGGAESDSERDISVGGVGHVPARACSTASTTPRSATCTGRRCCARACATAGRRWPTPSPRPAHVKGSWLVELGPGGLGRVEQVPAPVPRPLSLVTGAARRSCSPAASTTPVEGHWLSVVLTDPVRPDDADGPAAAALPARPGARLAARPGRLADEPQLRRPGGRARRPRGGRRVRAARPRRRRSTSTRGAAGRRASGPCSREALEAGRLAAASA